MPQENAPRVDDAEHQPQGKKEEATIDSSIEHPEDRGNREAGIVASNQPSQVPDGTEMDDEKEWLVRDSDSDVDQRVEAEGPVEPGSSHQADDRGIDRHVLNELEKLEGIDEGSKIGDSEEPYSHVTDHSPKTHARDAGFDMAEARPAGFQHLAGGSPTRGAQNLDLLMDVTLPISIELGRTAMNIQDILNLGPGSVVELNKLAGEPVDLLVNNKIVAKGEVVVIDENFGVRVTSLVSPEERIRSLGD